MSKHGGWNSGEADFRGHCGCRGGRQSERHIQAGQGSDRSVPKGPALHSDRQRKSSEWEFVGLVAGSPRSPRSGRSAKGTMVPAGIFDKDKVTANCGEGIYELWAQRMDGRAYIVWTGAHG